VLARPTTRGLFEPEPSLLEVHMATFKMQGAIKFEFSSDESSGDESTTDEPPKPDSFRASLAAPEPVPKATDPVPKASEPVTRCKTDLGFLGGTVTHNNTI